MTIIYCVIVALSAMYLLAAIGQLFAVLAYCRQLKESGRKEAAAWQDLSDRLAKLDAT